MWSLIKLPLNYYVVLPLHNTLLITAIPFENSKKWGRDSITDTEAAKRRKALEVPVIIFPFFNNSLAEKFSCSAIFSKKELHLLVIKEFLA